MSAYFHVLKYQDSTDREVGDSNIYNLINFNLFDAVVLCQDTIQTPGVVESWRSVCSQNLQMVW